MSGKQQEPSELLTTAQALEEQLERFQSLAEAVSRQRLDSGSAVEKAAKLLQQAAECEGLINERVAGLSAALQHLRVRQEACTESLRECSESIGQRSAAFEELMRSYREIGEATRDLNSRIKSKLDAGGATSVAALAAEIDKGARDLASRAEGLVAEASSRGFPDVARLAEGLRQQLLAALNKLKLASNKVAIA